MRVGSKNGRGADKQKNVERAGSQGKVYHGKTKGELPGKSEGLKTSETLKGSLKVKARPWEKYSEK